MNIDEKKDFVIFRMKEAKESYLDSILLLENKSFRSSVNRAYYSMFYAVLALANLSELSVSKYAGVIAFFDKEYIKTGIFTKEYSKYLHTAFELRQESDYLDFKDISLNDAEKAVKAAEKFLKTVFQHIQEKYSLFFPFSENDQ